MYLRVCKSRVNGLFRLLQRRNTGEKRTLFPSEKAENDDISAVRMLKVRFSSKRTCTEKKKNYFVSSKFTKRERMLLFKPFTISDTRLWLPLKPRDGPTRS